VPALYGNPATVARQIASLDHVSKGRAAWNIITSQHDHTLAMFGLDGELPQAAKYDKAEEFVAIVMQLWQSLPPAAIVADAARSAYIDEDRLRPIDFQGDYYRAAGVLGVTGGYRSRPVLLQAGASELSKQFGSKWADALFTSHWMKPSAQEFYRDVKQLAAHKWGRDPEQLLVVPGVYPVLGATEAEARQRKADLDDRLDLEYLKGSLASVLGVAAGDLDLSRPLPYAKILQARGRFRTEYESTTFRGNLGLDDPA
jgi:alkanesulfonate monooxygenase SsuD/methylene tetrahydromethanopterin reductase-like flavin-dependent oxidoreductase (luciferase family)